MGVSARARRGSKGTNASGPGLELETITRKRGVSIARGVIAARRDRHPLDPNGLLGGVTEEQAPALRMAANVLGIRIEHSVQQQAVPTYNDTAGACRLSVFSRPSAQAVAMRSNMISTIGCTRWAVHRTHIPFCGASPTSSSPAGAQGRNDFGEDLERRGHGREPGQAGEHRARFHPAGALRLPRLTEAHVNRMHIETTTDEAGALRIQIPGRPGRHHVHVTVEWESSRPPASEWPPGWVDGTAGSISDPTFIRHPQGEFEERETLG
jgi:hypothetical protein